MAAVRGPPAQPQPSAGLAVSRPLGSPFPHSPTKRGAREESGRQVAARPWPCCVLLLPTATRAQQHRPGAELPDTAGWRCSALRGCRAEGPTSVRLQRCRVASGQQCAQAMAVSRPMSCGLQAGLPRKARTASVPARPSSTPLQAGKPVSTNTSSSSSPDWSYLEGSTVTTDWSCLEGSTELSAAQKSLRPAASSPA